MAIPNRVDGLYLFQVDGERHVLVPVTVVQRRALPPRAGRVVHRIGRTVGLGRVAGPGVAHAALLRRAVFAVHLRSVFRLAASGVRRDRGPRSYVEYLRVQYLVTVTAAAATSVCTRKSSMKKKKKPTLVKIRRYNNNQGPGYLCAKCICFFFFARSRTMLYK